MTLGRTQKSPKMLKKKTFDWFKVVFFVIMEDFETACSVHLATRRYFFAEKTFFSLFCKKLVLFFSHKKIENDKN